MRIAARQRSFSERKLQRFSRKSHAIVVTMVKCEGMMMVVKEMVMGRNTFFEAKLAEKASPALSLSRKRRGRRTSDDDTRSHFPFKWSGRGENE